MQKKLSIIDVTHHQDHDPIDGHNGCDNGDDEQITFLLKVQCIRNGFESKYAWLQA
jgi:hypothetical protein